MTKKLSESIFSTWQRRVISRHNNIPLMHQHSLEQISFLEKFCTEKIANNTLTIQMAIPILSELAQHGSSVFSRLDDYLDSLSHNNGLTEYRDTLRELHKTTHKIGTDALKSFDKDVVKRLYLSLIHI